MLDASLNFLWGSVWLAASAQAATFEQLAQRCAPGVHPVTLQKIVAVESAHNPFAIGVVNGRVRQPKTLIDAVLTAQRLEKRGDNFSLGLAQINRYNLAKYGENYQSIFEPCRNLKTGAAILTDCYLRAKLRYPERQQALRAALSCYYSGNFTRGFRREGGKSYVQRVIEAKTDPQIIVPAIEGGHMASVTPASPTQTQFEKRSDMPSANWIQQYTRPDSVKSIAQPPSSFVTFY